MNLPKSHCPYLQSSFLLLRDDTDCLGCTCTCAGCFADFLSALKAFVSANATDLPQKLQMSPCAIVRPAHHHKGFSPWPQDFAISFSHTTFQQLCCVSQRSYVPSCSAAPFSSSSSSLTTSRSWENAWPATSHVSQYFCCLFKVSSLWILKLQVLRKGTISLFCICVTHSDREMPLVSGCFGNTN